MTFSAGPHPSTPPPATSWAPDELSQPLYGASMGEAVTRFFRKYADFSGRASLSEFWWVQLVLTEVVAALYVLLVIGLAGGSGAGGGPGVLGGLALLLLAVLGLGAVVPQYALIWRRLHDANLAGPMYFLGAIPFVGGLVVLVLLVLPSNPAGSRFDAWR